MATRKNFLNPRLFILLLGGDFEEGKRRNEEEILKKGKRRNEEEW